MTNTTFAAQYATARHELARLEASATPVDAAMRARMGEERFAALDAMIQEAAAQLPVLRARVAELEERACWKCNGTGEYDGASRYHRRGSKWCFACGGTGEKAAK